jgi:hypothetical protein
LASPETQLQALVDELGNQSVKVKEGNLTRAESLLTTQAHTLDAIFNELARRAVLNMGEHINAADTYGTAKCLQRWNTFIAAEVSNTTEIEPTP